MSQTTRGEGKDYLCIEDKDDFFTAKFIRKYSTLEIRYSNGILRDRDVLYMFQFFLEDYHLDGLLNLTIDCYPYPYTKYFKKILNDFIEFVKNEKSISCSDFFY